MTDFAPFAGTRSSRDRRQYAPKMVKIARVVSEISSQSQTDRYTDILIIILVRPL